MYNNTEKKKIKIPFSFKKVLHCSKFELHSQARNKHCRNSDHSGTCRNTTAFSACAHLRYKPSSFIQWTDTNECTKWKIKSNKRFWAKTTSTQTLVKTT